MRVRKCSAALRRRIRPFRRRWRRRLRRKRTKVNIWASWRRRRYFCSEANSDVSDTARRPYRIQGCCVSPWQPSTCSRRRRRRWWYYISVFGPFDRSMIASRFYVVDGHLALRWVRLLDLPALTDRPGLQIVKHRQQVLNLKVINQH